MVSKMCAADWIIGSRSVSCVYQNRLCFNGECQLDCQIVTIFDDGYVSVEKYGWFRYGIYVGQFEKLS